MKSHTIKVDPIVDVMRKRKPTPLEQGMLTTGDRVISFIETLTNTAGPNAGKPFLLRAWQRGIIKRVYDPQGADGLRTVRQLLLTMGRKNGKTELIAALCLAHLFGPVAEKNGEIYSAAADRFQAALVFRAAVKMIMEDPALMNMVNIIDSQKRIVHYASGSIYQALSSDSKTKHGFNASVVVYDELAQAPNRDLFDVLTTSQSARAQPLLMVISTQSADNTSVMSELVDYASKVADGIVRDSTFVAALYITPLDADPWDEATWYIANPALGDFRSLEEMRSSAEKAKRIPARESAFRNLYLNQEVNSTRPFLSVSEWKNAARTYTVDDLRGKKCYGGLDLSSTRDLTSLVLAFPEAGDEGETLLLPFFWVPQDGLLDKEAADRVPYVTWERQGWLETIPGAAIDKRYIVRRLNDLLSMFDIIQIGYDRWRFQDLLVLLKEHSLDEQIEFVSFGQGFRDMSPAVEAFETLLVSNKLHHNGSPVLTWNIANAVADTDPAGSRKLTKANSKGRIDGAVASLMAVGVIARHAPEGASVYDEQGRGIQSW